MGRLAQRKKDEREENIQEAIKHYNSSDEPSIRLTSEAFGVPYSTLRGRLGGVQSRGVGHRQLQLLSEYEDKAIAEWCEWLDECGHPPRLEVVKSMAQGIARRRLRLKSLGKHWLTRFLNRHPGLASKLSNPARQAASTG